MSLLNSTQIIITKKEKKKRERELEKMIIFSETFKYLQGKNVNGLKQKLGEVKVGM